MNDLAEADGLAQAGSDDVEWMKVRTTTARCAIAVCEGEWESALLHGERAASLQGGDLPVVAASVNAYMCDALIGLERADDAISLCSEAAGIEEAPLAEKARAGAILADALLQAGRDGEARERALESFEQAGAMGLLLDRARSASVLASLPAGLQSENIDQIIAEGRAALESYIEAVPEADRSAVRERHDVKRLYASL
jgi:hypothetical protein